METDINTNNERVVYTMDPYVADELAVILQREARRNPDKVDQGWAQDAIALLDASNTITDPETERDAERHRRGAEFK